MGETFTVHLLFHAWHVESCEYIPYNKLGNKPLGPRPETVPHRMEKEAAGQPGAVPPAHLHCPSPQRGQAWVPPPGGTT